MPQKGDYMETAQIAAPQALRVPVNDMLDTTGAAAFLGLARRTLEIWRCKKKGPPYFKVGSLVRYRRADLQEWLDSRPVLLGYVS